MSRFALAPGCAREYETIYIMRPNVDKEAVDGLANRAIEAVRGHGGKVTEVELWGRRRLAYTIHRFIRGLYVYVKYLGTGATVSELERQLSLVDTVVRFQTVRLRDNVPLAEMPEQAVKADFELVDDGAEPEINRERELGLDQPPGDRRPRRDDRRERGDGEDGEDEMGDGDADGDFGGGHDREEA